MDIYFDIETIPTQRDDVREHVLADMRPPSNYKKPEAIEKWKAENEEDTYRRTALEGGYGQICCMSWACDDDDVRSLAAWETDESAMLRLFYELIGERAKYYSSNPRWIGFNIGFDLRFLHHRSVICGVRPSVYIPYNDASWKRTYVDLQFEWFGARPSQGSSLKSLCLMLGIEVDDEISGADVWDAYQAERWDQIERHCIADVERVREIDKRLRWVK